MDDETVEQVTITQTPTGEVQKQVTTRKRSSLQEFFVSKTNQVIFTFVGIINLLLLLRIVFLLLGANRVGIVDFIISLTGAFVAPFVGIFDSPSSGDSYFDVASVVAMIIYLIFGVILSVIIDLFSEKNNP